MAKSQGGAAGSGIATRYFPTSWKVFSPIWGKRKIPTSRKLEFPTSWKRNFPTRWKVEFPTSFFSMIPMNRIWLLALLSFMDSVGFAIQVENPGMMQ